MTLYFVLLAIPSLLAILRIPATIGSMSTVALIYTIMGGFRYEVGMDWSNYQRLHGDVEYMSFHEIIFESEPLSFLLFKLSSIFCDCMLLTNCFSVAVLTAGIFLFSSRTPAPWIAIVSATPYLYIAFGLSGVRQAIGIGISLIVFSFWDHRRLYTTLPLIGLGALFHSSASIIGIFYAACIQTTKKTKIFFMLPTLIFFGGLIFKVLGGQDTVQLYSDRYLKSSDVDSSGALFHVSFIAIPSIIFFLLRKKISLNIKFPELVTWGALVGLLLIMFLFVSSTGASRLSLYLYFVPMAVYPALCVNSSSSLDGQLRLSIIMIHFAILYVWLAFANNSFAHLPYQNIMFN